MTEIETIIQNCYEQECQQIGQPEEMEKFPETYDLPRLNYEGI